MDIRITKANVKYCRVCDHVGELRNAWDDEQKLLVDEGKQEEAKEFAGVPGYIIKDADEYKFSYDCICGNCMHAIIKGVDIINRQNLTGISLNSLNSK